MERLAKLYLLASGYKNLEKLPSQLQAEVKLQVGFNQNTEEVRAAPGIADEWFVMARQLKEDGQLVIERNWLYGTRCRRYAVVLNFLVGGRQTEAPLPVGSAIAGALVYFNPGMSLRALFKTRGEVRTIPAVAGLSGWDEAWNDIVGVCEKNPFAQEIPFIVNNIAPVKDKDGWLLRDANGKTASLLIPDDNLWEYLAATRGAATTISVLAQTEGLEMLGYWAGNKYLTV